MLSCGWRGRLLPAPLAYTGDKNHEAPPARATLAANVLERSRVWGFIVTAHSD
jgi:hypothetical protein